MAIRGNEIASVLKSQIEDFGSEIKTVNIGTVIEVGDGVARVHGLSEVSYNELVEFDGNIAGMALNLEEDSVGIVILGDPSTIKEGTEVRGTGKVMEVPVGDPLLGRVVDGIGLPIDGKGPVNTKESRAVEIVAPNVAIRKSVDTPLQTGIKSIDAAIPIGRGQRELIIGDRTTGKTAICIDTIINQKGGDVICIYVAIGQKVGKVATTVATLEQFGGLTHTIVVAANASDAAAMQYLAPYTGISMAEYFMAQGKDVLIAYDDLSKHAWAYRQMSLLLKRPPGREAYPGDVFYLHSRLLERAAKLDDEHGGGSITALPVIETQAGDVSAYVPTNVISITDGQIYLEPELFNAGTRPAVNVGLSVSRVGSAAQSKSMKSVAGQMRLDLAQYRELVTFAQFGTDDLDAATKRQLARGQRSVEVLKQAQNVPLPVGQQVAMIYALNEGYLDDVNVENIKSWEEEFHKYFTSNYSNLLDDISNALTDESKSKLNSAIEEFRDSGLV